MEPWQGLAPSATGAITTVETTGDFIWSESERPDRAAAEPSTVIA